MAATPRSREERRQHRSSPYTPRPMRRSPRLAPLSSTSSHSRTSTTRSSQPVQSPLQEEPPISDVIEMLLRSPRTPVGANYSPQMGSTSAREDPVHATRRSPRLQASPPTPDTQRISTDTSASVADLRRHQLVVKPIIKTTFSQRERSGDQLDDVVFNGASFTDIMEKIWERFSSHVKGRAVKRDGTWAVEVPTLEGWSNVMQFKTKRHLVDSTKSATAWDRWLQSNRGETAILLIYEFGLATMKDSDLKAFKDACITPTETDRAGATAESSLQEVVVRLQEHWGTTFQGEAVVWRMWANHLTRNLNRSTWEAAIAQPPPDSMVHLLQASDSHVEQHLANITRSANLALDCVNASIADYQALRDSWEAFGRRMEAQMTGLTSRKSVIQAIISDVLPLSDVADPLQNMENTSDVDYQE